MIIGCRIDAYDKTSTKPQDRADLWAYLDLKFAEDHIDRSAELARSSANSHSPGIGPRIHPASTAAPVTFTRGM